MDQLEIGPFMKIVNQNNTTVTFKKFLKIRELSDLNEILSTYSLMNELCTTYVILLEHSFAILFCGVSYLPQWYIVKT